MKKYSCFYRTLYIAIILFCGISVTAMTAMTTMASAENITKEKTTILALGDSLTAGYGLDKGLSFPAKLQTRLIEMGIDVVVVNGGVSGDTSAGGLARIGWLLNPRPDAVIIELGANDGLRGLDPASTRNNIDAIISMLKGANIPVLLTGMQAPPNLGRDYGAEFNSIYPEMAAKHGTVYYPFYLKGVAAVAELNQKDGIHPNAQGGDIIVGAILPSVRQLIEQIKPKRK